MNSLPDIIQRSLHRTPSYPGGKGRGIVIVASAAYLPSAFVAIRHLRAHGCQLRVQLWHFGESDIPPFFRTLADSCGAELVDAFAAAGAGDFHRLGGWECKIHAIVACPFEQVLLLDADNIPLMDPSFLFDCEQFTRYGQVFWPDFFYQPESKYALRPLAWRELGLPARVGLELDSAQLLVDRKCCWRELQVCRLLNIYSEQCYDRWTWGDKDTFTLAWLLTHRSYFVVPIRPRFVQPDGDSVFWQHWVDGSKLFQHQRKWFHAPQKMADFLQEDELLKEQSLDYLREFWDAARAAGQESQLSAMLIRQPRQEKTISRTKMSASTAEDWQRLGTVAFARGELADALDHLKQAVALAPGKASLRVDLAALLSKSNQPTEAIPHLLQALRVRGDMPEIHNNLGVVLEQLGRYSESVEACRNATRLRPSYVEAHHNLGKALRKAGDPMGSIHAFREALRLRADSIPAYDGLVNAAEDLGDVELLCASLRRLIELQPDASRVRSSLLYTLHYHPDAGPPELFHEHCEWDRLFGGNAGLVRPFKNDRSRDRRIRVGYVSPDFREHTVTKFIGAALEHHDRDRIEVFCYSDVAEPDWVTERIRRDVEHWRDIVGFPDEQVERIVQDDSIDILVDLRGHASGNRMTLFARKPAPVQINMVGYFDTTGLSAMDYRLSDAYQDPPGETERYHRERILRMPGSCWCYMADKDAPDVAPSPLERAGHLTFGSLNKIVKVTDPCAQLWARVLEAVPNSRLLLAVVSEEAMDAIRKRLARAGLPPERLLLVCKTQGRHEYLQRFGQIDIALDTFPFNGITTTCDGLWMGVPCIGLVGATSVSRAGRSILHAAGLGQFSAETPEQFVAAAVQLAQDRNQLRELRLGMRRRLANSRLMDHIGFTRDLEAEYFRIWETWRAGADASV